MHSVSIYPQCSLHSRAVYIGRTFFVPSRSRRWSSVHFLRPLLKTEVFYVFRLSAGRLKRPRRWRSDRRYFTRAWVYICLPERRLGWSPAYRWKLRKAEQKSEPVFSKSFDFRILFWSAQNRFSDVSLLLLEGAKQVRPLTQYAGTRLYISGSNRVLIYVHVMFLQMV